jgi:hypothetical protein
MLALLTLLNSDGKLEKSLKADCGPDVALERLPNGEHERDDRSETSPSI